MTTEYELDAEIVNLIKNSTLSGKGPYDEPTEGVNYDCIVHGVRYRIAWEEINGTWIQTCKRVDIDKDLIENEKIIAFYRD